MQAGPSARRTPLAVYVAELSIGTVAGLALFLLLLWMLQGVFPDATGLGDLVRHDPAAHRNPAPTDGMGDSAPVATLSAVHRDVRDKPASSVVWSVAKSGSALGDGDAVQSQAGSGATITFDEHNRLELGEKSLIVVRKSRHRDDSMRRGASVLFMDGVLRARLGSAGPDAPSLELIAGGGSVRPHSAGSEPVEIALALDRNNSALSVRSGAAEVVWNDRVTVVPSGYMVTFDPEHAPGKPAPLPEPPVASSPADGESFRYRAAPPRVSFSWHPTDDASEFTLQIARDPRFTEVVFERQQTETSFTHGALAAGEYHWRVLGRRGSIVGPAGRTSRFTVEANQRPPRLRVDLPGQSVAGRTTVIRGETEPGCRVILGDVAAEVDAAGRFEHTLTLNEGYNFVVVQAVDSVGNTAFESRTIVAESQHSQGNP